MEKVRYILFALLNLQTLPSIIVLTCNGLWFLFFIPIIVFLTNMYLNKNIAIKILKLSL